MPSFTDEDLETLHLGIQQFNDRDFFHCHETLEKLWLKQEGDTKGLLQGLIQLAVAYHHLLAGNNDGAYKLFKRCLPRLELTKPKDLDLNQEELCCLIRANICQMEKMPSFTIDSIVIPSLIQDRDL
jgi:predicted metal-dependent hydrolase